MTLWSSLPSSPWPDLGHMLQSVSQLRAYKIKSSARIGVFESSLLTIQYHRQKLLKHLTSNNLSPRICCSNNVPGKEAGRKEMREVPGRSGEDSWAQKPCGQIWPPLQFCPEWRKHFRGHTVTWLWLSSAVKRTVQFQPWHWSRRSQEAKEAQRHDFLDPHWHKS